MPSFTRRTALLAGCLMIAASAALTEERPEPASGCGPNAFAEVIDRTGAYLRGITASTQPELRRRFDRLARIEGWKPEEAEERSYELVHDAHLAAFDANARKLLIELDTLGAVSAAEADCARLERLRDVAQELRRISEAKARHLTARLDAAIAATEPATAAAKAPPSAAAPPSPPSSPAPPGAASRPAQSAPGSREALVTSEAWSTEKRAAPPAPSPDWQTSTTTTPEPSETPSRPLAETLPRPAPVPAEQTYSTTEIQQAGRGLFGSISASLASVIRYAFDTYGEPNGYILGTEGGGALLAGLSYGRGRLHTKMGPPLKVYWQGPTVGYDLGLTGSRVLFLVYNLKNPEDIFRRFGGLGGSAYVVGGVGLTYHMRGSIVLAPIRTGLGLRIGANIGYLKFTPELNLNPF